MSNTKSPARAANTLLPHWLAEKIERTNYALSDFMHLALQAHRGMEGVFFVSNKNMEILKENAVPMATLMNMPFLALSPALADHRDWQTFVEGRTTSTNVDKLTAAMPMVDHLTARDIFHYNRTYIQMLKDVLHMSLVAAPILGLSHDLAQYLREKPIALLEAAIGGIGFPLFRWRFNEPNFWREYAAGWLTEESVAHYLMHGSPLKAAALPYKHLWANLRIERHDKDAYAIAMMTQGCRASTASNLFNLMPTKARSTYKSIHGVSSPCGCNPSSLVWYVDQAIHRLQGTAYTWIYRCGLASGGNIPEALIAANDLISKMFGTNSLITADRGNHLTRSMAMDSRLTMAPCRGCGTHYIISNGEGKIELAKDFACPGCNYLLTTKTLAAKRRIAQ